MTVRVAAAQFFSGTDVEENLTTCREYVARAAARGAQLVVLPENANRVRDYADRDECWRLAEREDGAFASGLGELAARYRVHLVAGVDLATDERPVVRIGQLLFGPDGRRLARVDKHVLWDYEYTLFEPATEPFAVHDTALGRLGLLMCADGIVPETPRELALSGAQVLCNSLNSRGPDEARVHVPLRAMENGVFHVAANTVGGPADAAPWTGGSQVVAPDGTVLAAASETDEELVVADIAPAEADARRTVFADDLDAWRRPECYGLLAEPTDRVPAAGLYGPADAQAPPRPVTVAMLQVSHYHSDAYTRRRVRGQVEWAGRQGAQLGVLPELFAHDAAALARDPRGEADRAPAVLDELAQAATDAGVWVAGSLVQREGDELAHEAVLIDDSGEVAGRYRKTHLGWLDAAWATPGERVPVFDTPLGRVGMLIGEEIWSPELFRVLALQGAELVVHPTSWRHPAAAHQAATERVEENRVHLVSVTRLDDPSGVGSQAVRANEFRGGEPIALMRYPTAQWTRPGFEEQLVVPLDLREATSKMMGHHLDPLATRQPGLYREMTRQRVARP